MSKDRELLIEIMSYIAKGKLKVERLESNEYENIRETKELLAQPEQEPEQSEHPIYIIGIGWQCDEMPAEGVKLYTAPPKREPFKPDWVNYRQGVEDSKREPLSDEDIRVIIGQLPTEVDLDTGIEFCMLIEKAHGIGESE
jgi:hypothetical protein